MRFPNWLKNPWSWFGLFLLFATFAIPIATLTGHSIMHIMAVGMVLFALAIVASIVGGLRRAGASALQIGMMAYGASKRLTSHTHSAGPDVGGNLHGPEDYSPHGRA